MGFGGIWNHAKVCDFHGKVYDFHAKVCDYHDVTTLWPRTPMGSAMVNYEFSYLRYPWNWDKPCELQECCISHYKNLISQYFTWLLSFQRATCLVLGYLLGVCASQTPWKRWGKFTPLTLLFQKLSNRFEVGNIPVDCWQSLGSSGYLTNDGYKNCLLLGWLANLYIWNIYTIICSRNIGTVSPWDG